MTIKATRPGGSKDAHLRPVVDRLMRATEGHLQSNQNKGPYGRDPHAPIADNGAATDLNHKIRMERTNRGLFG